jgi:uncharacterized Fe-S cluster protein YjdI
MSIEKIKYTNGEVTVVWQPKLCIHSAICAKGLPGVFNPARKPWVNMAQAETQQIVEQVRKCPSGALSYFLNETENKINMENKIVSEAANITRSCTQRPLPD